MSYRLVLLNGEPSVSCEMRAELLKYYSVRLEILKECSSVFYSKYQTEKRNDPGKKVSKNSLNLNFNMDIISICNCTLTVPRFYLI